MIAAQDLGFKSSAERIINEKAERLELLSNPLSFGDKFLDKALCGILRTDFVLLGAVPGAGKTEKSTDIALANVRAGKHVHFFALEAEEKEVERRIKFKTIMELYFKDHPDDTTYAPRYSEWYLGHHDEILSEYEIKAEEQMGSLKNLHTYYRAGEFGIDEFSKIVMGLNDKTDLIVCDHLHYFDLEDPNENKAVKEVMKQMRDLVLITKIPVVLVAHLRKLDKRNMPIVPDLDDFHGTSDIGKIVTKAITMAPAGYHPENLHQSYTFIRPVKARMDGGVKRYIARMIWDGSRNQFTNQIVIGEIAVDQGKEYFKPIQAEKIPRWLK